MQQPGRADTTTYAEIIAQNVQRNTCITVTLHVKPKTNESLNLVGNGHYHDNKRR